MGSLNPTGSTNPRTDNGYFDYSLVIGPTDYRKSAYNGVLMTSAILGTNFILSQIGLKKYTPALSIKDYFSLATVSILSQLAIDYGKAKGKIPSGLR